MDSALSLTMARWAGDKVSLSWQIWTTVRAVRR